MNEMEYIPYGLHDIDETDIEEVNKVLRGDWLTQGEMVPTFEQAVTERVGAKYAVAMNSATSALHLACLALEVGPGDTVWTSANSFVASANCALYCGASVDFVDIDEKTYNISIDALERKLSEAKRIDKLPKVVIPVHFSGLSCNMNEISRLSDQYGFRVIEDASHAIGSKYKKEPVGSCKWSDITIFSFHPVKIITSGEGGMALTNSKELSNRMQLLRTSGITKDPIFFEKEGHPAPWYYEQLMLGYNYRMNDIQAALGTSQMRRLDTFLDKRNILAKNYNMLLSENVFQLPVLDDNSFSSFHLYVILLSKDISEEDHLDIFSKLRKDNIGVNLHYMPIYLQPFYRRQGFKKGHCPNSESYAKRAISLPIFPGLSSNDQDRVVSSLKKAAR